MFRSRSSTTKDANKVDDSKLSSYSSSKESKTEIPVDIGKVESICYKKCVYALNTPSLSAAEKNCLDRCAYKFKESIDYGHNILLYVNYRIRDANKDANA